MHFAYTFHGTAERDASSVSSSHTAGTWDLAATSFLDGVSLRVWQLHYFTPTGVVLP